MNRRKSVDFADVERAGKFGTQFYSRFSGENFLGAVNVMIKVRIPTIAIATKREVVAELIVSFKKLRAAALVSVRWRAATTPSTASGSSDAISTGASFRRLRTVLLKIAPNIEAPRLCPR